MGRPRRVRVSRNMKGRLLTNKRQRWRSNAFKAQGGKCFYCRVEMVMESAGKFDQHRLCTLDHKTPLDKGGADHWENSSAACAKCNQAKGNKTEAEFRASPPLSSNK